MRQRDIRLVDIKCVGIKHVDVWNCSLVQDRIIHLMLQYMYTFLRGSVRIRPEASRDDDDDLVHQE